MEFTKSHGAIRRFDEGEWVDQRSQAKPLPHDDAGQVAAELFAIAARLTAGGQAIPSKTSIEAKLVRTLIAARRERERFFNGALFGEPGWDMLLDLTAATIERRLVSVSSLCLASGAPTSTALRAIKTMVQEGIIERRDDPDDLRRSFIVLTPKTFETMIAFLNSARDRLIAANK